MIVEKRKANKFEKDIAKDKSELYRKMFWDICENNKHQESLVVFYINCEGKVEHAELVFRGTLDNCELQPREIMALAFKLPRIKSLVICHNHPSNSTRPSFPDKMSCGRMSEVCDLCGFILDDFIIFTETETLSFICGGLLCVN